MKPKAMVSRRSRALLLVGLLVAGLATPACAAHPVAKLAAELGLWLAGQAASYGTVKLVEKAAGVDLETRLEDVRRDLEVQIARSQGVQRQELEDQLAVVNSQLTMLDRLLRDKVSRDELERMKQQVSRDLTAFKNTLSDHELRLDRLESKIDMVVQRLELRALQSSVSLHVGTFSRSDGNIPQSVATTAREALLEALSRDSRILLATSPSVPFDVQVEGTVIRLSTDQSTFSGFNTNPRPAVKTTLEVSIRLLDASGRQNFFTQRYRREQKRMLAAGSDPYGYSENLGHDLVADALQEAVGDILVFLFPEEP